MRPQGKAGSWALTLCLGILLPGIAATAAVAQEPAGELRREIVIVGTEPAHSRVLLEQMASRGYLGVQLLDLTPELRRHFGAGPESGVLVSRVTPESPAEAAGVAVGDLITSVDGEPVRTTSQLVIRVGDRREGDEIELEVVRDRSPVRLRATLVQAERRQVEIGQFVWRGTDDGPLVMELDSERVERVIQVDPETINESVRKLLARLEAEGGLPGRLHLQSEQRQQLEKRISELEKRLREMEQELEKRLAEE